MAHHGGVVVLAQTMEVLRLLPASWSPAVNDIITWSLLVSAVGVLIRYVIKPIVSAVKRINQIWDRLQHEFEPNSGTSLRDAVDRTDLRVAEMSDKFEDMDIRMDRFDSKLSGLDAKLSQHMDDVKDNGGQ